MIREMKDKEMLLENVEVTTIKIKGRMNTLRTLKKKNKIYSHSKKQKPETCKEQKYYDK